MSLAHPTATITLAGEALSAAEAALVEVRLDLGLQSHDAVRLVLWSTSRLAGASPGDTLEVGLSAGDGGGGGLLGAIGGLASGSSDGTVWTGTVQDVRTAAEHLVITGLASTARLSTERRSATWAEQSVADIVRDLVGDLDAEIDADLELQSYSIDNRRTVWSHLLELARLAGAELGGAAEGGVRFVLAARESSVTELRYGADLVGWQIARREASTPVLAAEHGVASSAGSDKWHWVAHDPVGAGGEATRIPGAFRSRDSADQYNEAAAGRAERATVAGIAWTGGRPDLRPGGWVELTGLPEGDSGELRIRAVTHQLDTRAGFVSALALEGAGGDGGLGGPL